MASLLGDGAGVAAQVDLLALLDQGPARGPEGAVARDVHVVLGLPRVLDHAAQRQDHADAGQHRAGAEQTLDGGAATQGRRLPGVVQQGDDGLLVGLGGRAVVAALNRDLLGHEALGVLHGADAQGDDRAADGDAEHRGVEGVDPQALVTVALVLPGPEQVHGDERQTQDDRENQPGDDAGGGTLLGRVPLDGEALLAVGDGHVVELGAQAGQLVVAHLRQLLGAVVLLHVVGHCRDPIQSAAATRATMPAIHMNRPSVTGPRPPSG